MKLFQIIIGGAITVIVLSLIGMVILISLMIKGCEKVEEKGLKNIVEDVWEGPQG